MRAISILTAATICASVVVAPAMAHPRHHVYRHHYQRQNVSCSEARRESGNSGTVLGAVAGGGALIGHQIGKSNHPC